MPVISMFYGVIVMMYYFDDKQHHLPHIHVEYAEESAVLAIPSGEVRIDQILAAETRAGLDRDSSGGIDGQLEAGDEWSEGIPH